MKHGFVKVAAAVPEITVANPSANAAEIIKLIKKADAAGAEVLVFPELCVTGYTCGDLFLSSALKKSSLEAIEKIVNFSKKAELLFFIGTPVRHRGRLFSCAIAVQKGKILGIVPKTAVTGSFSSGETAGEYDDIKILGQNVPFGTDLIFTADENSDISVAAEIGEDMFMPAPPSIRHAQEGAAIMVNLAASTELAGKSDYIKTLIKACSGRLAAGYVYASAGKGESVSDALFSGRRIIAENGEIISESGLYETGLTICEIDTEKLGKERIGTNFIYSENEESGYRFIPFQCFPKKKSADFVRVFSSHPFIPQDISQRAELILQIQSKALAARLKFTGLNAVIGVSGGLDSCLALLVILRSYEILGKDKKDVIAVTMPGLGTSKKTLKNVEYLSKALGIGIRNIPITDAVNAHLKDISHKGVKDTAYENAQARERTQILMDIANAEKGLVTGTGDLSEIALGWNTYNGDHMSMYSVNCTVPKTLVKHLISYEGNRVPGYKKALAGILNTEISPELLPAKNGKILQKTENIIGPYELHDFFLYYTVRFGFCPEKILFLAEKAFSGKYKREKIKRTFTVFIKRFFANQFKRNCVPDGVKAGSVSLSPRGDWQMPAEGNAGGWIKDI
ncbi:MAG: NAD(+) synthase [Endomicrobium sp.]|jgi:NAD+ synthase (glutamine-hydrolysing)|nr:NAD(+) synthase [Endomicrobium sp.]